MKFINYLLILSVFTVILAGCSVGNNQDGLLPNLDGPVIESDEEQVIDIDSEPVDEELDNWFNEDDLVDDIELGELI